MSLQTLLVDFPNFSARRIRRLAKQLTFVEQATKHVDDPSVGRGISEDLMAFTVAQARAESQLNDDVREATPAEKVEIDDVKHERICVTPHSAAIKAINEMLEWMRVNTDATMKGDDLKAISDRCRGLVNGQSFYTDRTIIQARMSPQDSLPLETEAGRGGFA